MIDDRDTDSSRDNHNKEPLRPDVSKTAIERFEKAFEKAQSTYYRK